MKGPLFSFFGAKWRMAPRYPKPGDKIVELFAGSACYASRYPDRDVLLVERDPLIAKLWRWLIEAEPDEIRALPNVDNNTRFPDLPIRDEAKWLMGFWFSQGTAYPRKMPTARHRNPATPWNATETMWPLIRERTAQGVAEIKHWQLFEGEWFDAPRVFGATYFIDPPYQSAGKNYRFHDVDYVALSNFCETIHDQGEQVIVCEAEGAKWLPFRPIATTKANSQGGARYSKEVVWP